MDRISALPQDTIDKILTLMPIRDAVRTSILSWKWRFCWTSMPRLAFTMLDVSSRNKEYKEVKRLKEIFHILLLHTGPILDFSICINDTEIANEINTIILYLSRSNNIKKFSFAKWRNNRYKLPLSFYSLQGLEHLVLMGCVIEPPIMFNGFSMLRGLCINNCMITVNRLLQLLINCPLLEEFTLDQSDEITGYIRLNECEFLELFKCLSAVQVLKLPQFCIMNFAVGDFPQKLPTPLVHLRILVFDVCFLQHDEVSCLLCVINSSPNLEKIKIKLEMCWEQVEDFENLFDLKDHSDLKLDHLKELEIIGFYNEAHGMDFVKLILAKSPVLKLARLKLHHRVTVDEELKMYKDLVRLPFPRASPAANFIIERDDD